MKPEDVPELTEGLRRVLESPKVKAKSKAVKHKHKAPTDTSIDKLRAEISRFNAGIQGTAQL